MNGLYVIILVGRKCSPGEVEYIHENRQDNRKTGETGVTLDGLPVKYIGNVNQWYVVQHICGELNNQGDTDGRICQGGIDPSGLPRPRDIRFKLMVLAEPI